jgi:spore coat protein U-like protein
MVMALGGALVALPALPASAQDITCTANNTVIDFGAFDVLGGGTLTGAGTFTVTCTNTNAPRTSVTYTASLAVAPTRRMAPPSGSDRITYQIYRDAARTQPWGNGTGGTYTITGSLNPQRNRSVSSSPINYYGLITPGGQDVSAASPGPPPTSYSQTLTITVTCTGSSNC